MKWTDLEEQTRIQYASWRSWLQTPIPQDRRYTRRGWEVDLPSLDRRIGNSKRTEGIIAAAKARVRSRYNAPQTSPDAPGRAGGA